MIKIYYVCNYTRHKYNCKLLLHGDRDDSAPVYDTLGGCFVCGTASKAVLAIFFLKIFSCLGRWGAMLATRVSK